MQSSWLHVECLEGMLYHNVIEEGSLYFRYCVINIYIYIAGFGDNDDVLSHIIIVKTKYDVHNIIK